MDTIIRGLYNMVAAKKKKEEKVPQKKTKKLVAAKTKKVVAKKKLVASKIKKDKEPTAMEKLFPKKEEKSVTKTKLSPKQKPEEIKRIAFKKPFDQYCALAICENKLVHEKEKAYKVVREEALDLFISSFEKGEQCDSFIGYQQSDFIETSALFVLKKKGHISEDLAQEFLKWGVDFNREVPHDPPCTDSYILNPELFHADQAMLKKIADALQGVEGIDLSSIFLPSQPEECVEPQAINEFNENTLASICTKIPDKEVRKELVKKVTTIQISQAQMDGKLWKSESSYEDATRILKKIGVIN